MIYEKKAEKTRNKINTAMLTLLETKRLDSITVADITEMADINRSTFYRHFIDKYDLIERLEQTIIDKLYEMHLNLIGNIEIDNIFGNESPLLKLNIFMIFEENLNTIKTLLSDNGDFKFRKKIQNLLLSILENVVSNWNKTFPIEEVNLLLNYHIAGTMGVIEYWINNSHISSTEIFELFSKINRVGILNYIKEVE